MLVFNRTHVEYCCIRSEQVDRYTTHITVHITSVCDKMMFVLLPFRHTPTIVGCISYVSTGESPGVVAELFIVCHSIVSCLDDYYVVYLIECVVAV